MTEEITKTPVVLEPSEHHPEGPSNFPMWDECPCYDGEKDPDDADIEALAKDEASAKGRGTAQHKALAKAITGIANAFEGLDEREEAEVRWVAEETVSGAALVGYQASEIRVEQRVTMFNPDFSVLFFGTADIDYGPYIDDAKFGEVRNYFPQMCGYALAKMDRDGFDRVYVRIRYGRWRKTVYHIIDRDVAERVVYSILSKRKSPDRQPKACQYCNWCRHIATCSAVNANVNVLLTKRADWGMKLPTMSTTEAGPDPVTIGAMKWLWKTYIESWGSAVDYQASIMADCGNVPLGFRKQNEKGRLEMNEKAFDALLAGGLPLSALKEASSFSMKALSKAYVAALGGSEASAAKKIEDVLVMAGAAKRGDAGFKLIRNKDAEDEIRAALARPVDLPLPEPKQVTDLIDQQGTT